MNNYIADLFKRISEQENAKAKIQFHIDELTEKKEKVQEKQQAALKDSDNAAYMAAFREIKEIETEIEGNKALLKAKKGEGVTIEELRQAWDKTVAEYVADEDRQRAVNDYLKAKQQLAEKFKALCQDDDRLNMMKHDLIFLAEGKLFLGDVPEFDAKRTANVFFGIQPK